MVTFGSDFTVRGITGEVNHVSLPNLVITLLSLCQLKADKL